MTEADAGYGRAPGFSAPKASSADQSTGNKTWDTLLDLIGRGASPEVAYKLLQEGQGAGGGSAAFWQSLGFSPQEAQKFAQLSALQKYDIPMGQTGFGTGAAAPRPTSDVDPRTGERLVLMPDGSMRRTGEQVGFAGVDPRDEFMEGVRRQGNSDAMGLAGFRDNAAQWRARMAQDSDQYGASLNEQARQADTSAALREFETRAGLIPAFGNITLGAAREQREILSGGGDYMARAFGQSGQNSPLALVTQADLINNMMRDLSKVESLVPESRVTGRQAYGGAPGLRAQSPAEAPQLAGFRGLTAAPAMGGTPGGWAGGGAAAPGGGGGGAPAAPDMSGFDAIRRVQAAMGSFGRALGGSASGGASGAAPAAPSGWASPDEAMGAARPNPRRPQAGRDWGAVANQPGPGALDWMFDGPAARKGYRGYADGGVTKEPVFITGEDGYELNIQTPEGVMVIPNEIARRLVTEDGRPKAAARGVVPGFEDGTSGTDPVREAQMLQRMGVEEMGGLGAMAGSLFGGPSGGGGVNMGKGLSQKITPELLKKAFAEFRNSDLLRRAAMDETGGGTLGGWIGKRMSPGERAAFGTERKLPGFENPFAARQTAGRGMIQRAEGARGTGGTWSTGDAPQDPTSRLDRMYSEMLDLRAAGDHAAADDIGDELTRWMHTMAIGRGGRAAQEGVDLIPPGSGVFDPQAGQPLRSFREVRNWTDETADELSDEMTRGSNMLREAGSRYGQGSKEYTDLNFDMSALMDLWRQARTNQGKIPGFASGTYGATAAIEDFNRGNTGALQGFNDMYSGMPGASGGFGGPAPAPNRPAATAPSWREAGLPEMGGRDMGNTSEDYFANLQRMRQQQAARPPAVTVNTPPQVSQEELAKQAWTNAPPRVKSVFMGQNPGAPQLGAGLPGWNPAAAGPGTDAAMSFKLPTARLLSGLSADDLAAYNTLVNVTSSGKSSGRDFMQAASNAATLPGFGRAGRVRGLGL